MRSNTRNLTEEKEAAKNLIADYMAEATRAITKAERVASERNLSFSFKLGPNVLTYYPEDQESFLTAKKAIKILESSQKLTLEMREKIALVLSGNKNVMYRKQDYPWLNDTTDYNSTRIGWVKFI